MLTRLSLLKKRLLHLYIDYIVKVLNAGSVILNLLTYYIFTTKLTLTTDTPIHFSRWRAFATEGSEHTLYKFLVSQMVSHFVRNHVKTSHEYPV